MTKRSTRHSLIMSAISLLLCASMLIGTTFAWFTDSVTSTGNIIKSGTLDVSLEWMEGKQNPADKNSAEWTDASDGAIFNYTKWEPGFTQVKHIKIENEGTLALKYKVNIVPTGTVVYPDGVNLADVIDVYYLDPAQQMDDRAELPASAKLGTLTEMLAGLATSGTGILKTQGEAVTITLALKMQEEAGNEYQDRSFGTEFAVQLLATQVEEENDSFDNKYDIDATFPIVVNEKVDDTTGKTIKAKDNVGNVIVAVDVPAGEAEYELNISEPMVSEENGEYTVTLDITLLKNGVKVDTPAPGVMYPVTVNVGAGLVINKVLHKTEEITAYNYDVFSGELSFETDSFSPFSVVYREVKEGEGIVVTTPEIFAKALENGGLYTIASDIVLEENNSIVIPEGKTVTLNLADNVISGGNDMSVQKKGIIVNNGTLEINGGEIKTTVKNAYSVIDNYGTLILNGVKIDSTVYDPASDPVPMYAVRTMNELIVNEGTVITGIKGVAVNKGHATFNGGEVIVPAVEKVLTVHTVYVWDDSTVTINGGTFKNLIPASFASNGGAAVICDASTGATVINGGYFESAVGTSYMTLHDYGFGGPVISVKGGTFKCNPASNNLAEGYVAFDNGDGTYTVVFDGKIVSNAADLVEAIAAGKDVILTENITLTEGVTIPADESVTLDMNGFSVETAPNTAALVCIGEALIKNGKFTLNTPADNSGSAGVLNIAPNAEITIENAVIEIDGATNHGVTITNGTLNLNDGSEIVLKGNGYLTGILSMGNDVVNINGGKITVATPADAQTSVGIGTYGTLTVNANSGELNVNAGTAHYGVAPYYGSITVNLNSNFVVNAESGATAFEADVTVVNQ